MNNAIHIRYKINLCSQLFETGTTSLLAIPIITSLGYRIDWYSASAYCTWSHLPCVCLAEFVLFPGMCVAGSRPCYAFARIDLVSPRIPRAPSHANPPCTLLPLRVRVCIPVCNTSRSPPTPLRPLILITFMDSGKHARRTVPCLMENKGWVIGLGDDPPSRSAMFSEYVIGLAR